jgi:hypothetical protein
MAKDILRKTEKKVAVKISGADVTETISLNSDLLSSSQALDGGVQKVNIISLRWTGDTDSKITVTRNSKVIVVLQGNSPGDFDFADSEYNDNVNNASNIIVTTVGNAQLYMNLRKESGYASKIETPEFSVYDDTTAVGS